VRRWYLSLESEGEDDESEEESESDEESDESDELSLSLSLLLSESDDESDEESDEELHTPPKKKKKMVNKHTRPNELQRTGVAYLSSRFLFFLCFLSSFLFFLSLASFHLATSAWICFVALRVTIAPQTNTHTQ
jgi:hypothetical protein